MKFAVRDISLILRSYFCRLGWDFNVGKYLPLNDQPDINQELELAEAAFDSGDEAGAAACFERLAEQGSAPAMTWAGYVYLHGKGVAVEKTLALKWFSTAAEAGDAEAMSLIGYMYASGEGVPVDMAMAHQWYLKAAEGGDAYGMLRVARLYFSGEGVAADRATARKWFLKAAETGDAEAMSWMGYIYAFGEGVPVDMAMAHQWYLKAAEGGHAYGMSRVAHLYFWGEGVAADRAAARKWNLRAAEAGDAYGQHSLSYMLDKDGEPEEAERWLRKAAEQGYEPALRSVREKRAYEMFKEKRYGEALPIFREAAGMGSAWSHEMLGYLYWRGYGVEVDRDRAIQRYEAAYDGGRSSVLSAIGRLHLSSGRPETALEWLRKDSPKPISSLYWQYRVLKEHLQLERYSGESGDVLRKAADAGHIFAKRDLTLQMLSGREGFRMRFRGAREWLGLFPRMVRMAVKDVYDERLG